MLQLGSWESSLLSYETDWRLKLAIELFDNRAAAHYMGKILPDSGKTAVLAT